MANTTTPNNDTKVPRRAWYIMGGVSLLPVLLVLIFHGISLVSHIGTGGSLTKFETNNPPRLLGTVDVPKGEWSEGVKNLQQEKITWGRIDLTKGGDCEIMMDGDSKKIFPISAQTRLGPTILQFKCSETGARIEVKTIKTK